MSLSSKQPPDLVPSPVNDISQIRWDQATFLGRFNHFSRITDPRLLLKSRRDVETAQHLYHLAKEGHVPRGTTQTQLYHAQTLYHSAVHPDTDEIMHPAGRMSAQVPCGMVITGILLALYKTTPQVMFAQFINQTFNAFVNYTNRNAKSQTTNQQIGKSYVGAMTGAVGVSVIANKLVKGAPPLVGRFVPFLAVATANCINIPMMRQGEISNGVIVVDKDGRQLGESKKAAAKGISQVCLSRITMAVPGMILSPVIMERLERYKFFRRGLVFSTGIQTLLCGISLIIMVPVGCALFPQTSSIQVANLEKPLRVKIQHSSPSTKVVYFNKGL
jgi:tricarboxylate carrier